MARSRRSAATFEQRYLAFVDILGFRDIVARMDAEPELFEIIRDSLKLVDQQARELRRYRSDLAAARRQTIARGIASMPVPDVEVQMTAFSDCYVLSEIFPAWHVLAAVQALGSTFIEKGILTRGAVVLGPAYHSGRVLFGPAVIEAYELESRVAKYPRILVTEAVRKKAWGYHRGVCGGQLFQQDVDGWWYVNILAPPISEWKALSTPSIESDMQPFLERVRPSLERQLRRSRGNTEHTLKTEWLVRKFNLVAGQEKVEPIACANEEIADQGD